MDQELYKKIHYYKRTKNILLGLWFSSFIGTLISVIVDTLSIIGLISIIVFGISITIISEKIDQIIYKSKKVSR